MDLSRNSGFSFVSPTSDNIQLAKGDNDNLSEHWALWYTCFEFKESFLKVDMLLATLFPDL